ncbi:phosphopantetheine binding protein [Micromonospora sp. Llam0]|uniref:acyl carrier protein n=1 Tax=Micromonospora sp. Llam0 TaxID=2485143 RepID=UPI000F47E17F|nr:acyl carrier protein [Micromonospora sp. Llam0]ROO51993.1 phosphopantetheine binding protein [Micromonospora sp. Llam0]
MADGGITDYVAVLRPALAEAVGLEESDIEPSATILGDLGAESIDLLDVLFRVERVVGVKISATEIADLLQGDLSDDEFEGPGGIVTAAGLDQLQRVLPQIDKAELAGRLVADDIMNLFTVENLAYLVAQRAAMAADAR